MTSQAPWVLHCACCALATAPCDQVAARIRRWRLQPPRGPSGQRLDVYEYQLTGASWLASRWAAVLADDMGLGKTVQALLALPVDAPVVVVCPAAAKPVWCDEASIWRPELSPYVVHGRGGFSAPRANEVAILNPELLQERVELGPGTVVIADEAHRFLNPAAARTRKWRALAQVAAAGGGRVWLLTGTPSRGKRGELWELLQSALVGEAAFERQGLFDLLEARSDLRSLARRLATVELRRRKDEVLADVLPPKLVQERLVVLPDETREEADQHVRAALGLDGWTEAQVSAAVEEAMDHHQACPAWEGLSRAREVLSRAKIPAMLEVVEQLEEAGELVVVASWHRRVVQALANRPGWGMIVGGLNDRRRTETVRAFQAGELRGLAVTIAAAGVALTLTAACHIVIADPSWVSVDNGQTEDRCYRLGQRRPVTVYYLVADHAVERAVQRVLRRKKEYLGRLEAARLAVAAEG